jgi:archaeosortase A (PGF-CTERM-specific)
MDILLLSSLILMIIFVASRIEPAGGLGWILFGIVWITKLPHYLEIGDYFNSVVVTLAFLFFIVLGITILTDKKKNLNTFVDITSFSALAAIVYFPFALNEELKLSLISFTADRTIALGHLLKFSFERYSDTVIMLNEHYVEIILACTGIESMALFSGATLGVRADLRRKIAAFLVSVPTIYILNLFRNVFVTASFAYSWFGENSFYIAHHVISKVLATLALILISLAVFKIIPELAELILNLKNVLVERWGWQNERK